jgi:hypothetical protein
MAAINDEPFDLKPAVHAIKTAITTATWARAPAASSMPPPSAASPTSA